MKYEAAIFADTEGIWIGAGSGSQYGIRWDDISETIVTLDFDFGEFMELNSGFLGFKEAISALNSKLAIDPAWQASVAILGRDSGSLLLWQRC